MSSGEPLVLGLDVGGSRTRAWLCDGDRRLGEAVAGSASLTAAGDDSARAAFEQVLAELGRPAVAAAVAGAAGCDTLAAREQMRGLLRSLLPDARVEVVHDARLVLAAAGLETGIVLIAGTGSVAYGAAPGGAEARAGGWGYLLGDEGSGYWVVREAIRRVLTAHDRGDPPTPLTERLLEAAGVRDPLDLTLEFHRRSESARWAALSGLVLAADPELLTSTAAHLARTALTVATRLGLPGPVVLAGGMLLGEAGLEQAVREMLASALPDAAVLRAEAEPVAGAVHLARKLAQDRLFLV